MSEPTRDELGTAPNEPAFTEPAAFAAVPPPAPVVQHPVPGGPPPPGWAPPPLPTSFVFAEGRHPGAPVPQQWAAPSGQGYPATVAQPPRRRWWIAVVAGIVILGLIAATALLWTRGVFSPAPTTSPSADPVPTAPATPGGGDVGRSLELTGSAGTATVTLTRAEWATTGELAPEPGTSYLVLDVEFTGVSGQVPVGPVMTVAQAADKSVHPVSYGPTMPELVPGALLRPGDTVAGSLGYMLPPGPVTIQFLDEDGEPMGTAQVPGP